VHRNELSSKTKLIQTTCSRILDLDSDMVKYCCTINYSSVWTVKCVNVEVRS